MDTTSRPAVNWKAAIGAGLLAGLVFLILEMVLVPLFLNGSPWGPPRMIGAIALGQDVLPSPPPPPTFDVGVVLVAMMIHFAISAVYGVVLAFIIHRLETGAALAVGAVFGLVLYLVNFYVVPALGIFPWFEMAQNWVSIVSHVVFGLLAAWLYVTWAPRRAARMAVA